MILQILIIDSAQETYLYSLKEINGRTLPGKYYASELKEIYSSFVSKGQILNNV
jgi:hypothetical protein